MNVNTEAPLRSIGQIASSIAQALQIPDLNSDDPTSFWRDAATALTQTYEGDSAAEIARWLIFDKFDREWDPDEALDEESGLPAVSAYEEILEIANRLQQAEPDDQAIPENIIAGDEEEEAGSDALAELSEDIGFSTADLGLETVLSQIHRGNLVISPEWQRSFV